MKRTIGSVLLIVLALVLALSALTVFAQDQQQTGNPFLGITFGAAQDGARITSIVPDSPAAQAELHVGDIITKIGDQTVTASNLADMVRSHQPGDTLALTILRNGQTMDLSATLGTQPAPATQNPREQIPQMFNRPYLGIRLEDSTNGVVIREVATGSPAADAGLQVGDVIKAVNGNDVTTAQAVTDAVRALNIGDEVTLDIERNGEAMTIHATLGSSPTPQNFNGDFIAYNGADQTWEIRNLTESNPLYSAGLRAGDVIQKFDGNAYDPAGLSGYLNSLDSNATVTVTIERNGATQDIDVPVDALMALDTFSFGQGEFPFNMMPFAQNGYLGVTFQPLDQQLAQEHNLSVHDGALITEVMPNSPAADAGLQVNDVVTAVNNEAVDAEHTLRDRLVAYEPGDVVTLSVLRGGNTMDIQVTMGQPQMSSDLMPFFFGPRGFDFNNPQAPQQPTQPNL